MFFVLSKFNFYKNLKLESSREKQSSPVWGNNQNYGGKLT